MGYSEDKSQMEDQYPTQNERFEEIPYLSWKWFKALWEGKRPLWECFWILCILVWLYSIFVHFIVFSRFSAYHPTFKFMTLIQSFIMTTLNIFCIVSLWRCAPNAKSKTWFYIARILTTLALIEFFRRTFSFVLYIQESSNVFLFLIGFAIFFVVILTLFTIMGLTTASTNSISHMVEMGNGKDDRSESVDSPKTPSINETGEIPSQNIQEDSTLPEQGETISSDTKKAFFLERLFGPSKTILVMIIFFIIPVVTILFVSFRNSPDIGNTPSDNKEPSSITLSKKENPESNFDYASVIGPDDPFTDLMIAASSNKGPEVIAELVRSGADVNARTENGRTALMYAAISNKSPEVIAELVRSGADVNARTQDGSTALMCAAGDNVNPEVIAELVRSGADVNARDINGRTALMQAAISNKSPEVIAELVRSGADVNAKDVDGQTALMLAAICNKSPEVIAELVRSGADVNARDINGWTALMFATRNDNPEIIVELIKAGVDVNAINEDGCFFSFLLFGNRSKVEPKIVADLIEAGVDVNQSDSKGWTALHYALLRNLDPENIFLLIDAGADVNAITKGITKIDATATGGYTPLLIAAKYYRYPGVVSSLIRAGAKLDAKNEEGYDAMFIAAKYSLNPEVVLELISMGMNINQKVKDGSTPVMIAAGFNENPEVVSALLSEGADASIRDLRGKRAIDYAKNNEKIKDTKAYWQLHDASFE